MEKKELLIGSDKAAYKMLIKYALVFSALLALVGAVVYLVLAYFIPAPFNPGLLPTMLLRYTAMILPLIASAAGLFLTIIAKMRFSTAKALGIFAISAAVPICMGIYTTAVDIINMRTYIDATASYITIMGIATAFAADILPLIISFLGIILFVWLFRRRGCNEEKTVLYISIIYAAVLALFQVFLILMSFKLEEPLTTQQFIDRGIMIVLYALYIPVFKAVYKKAFTE